eukprot:596833-Amphidinium_carterae.2
MLPEVLSLLRNQCAAGVTSVRCIRNTLRFHVEIASSAHATFFLCSNYVRSQDLARLCTMSFEQCDKVQQERRQGCTLSLDLPGPGAFQRNSAGAVLGFESQVEQQAGASLLIQEGHELANHMPKDTTYAGMAKDAFRKVQCQELADRNKMVDCSVLLIRTPRTPPKIVQQ